MSSGACPWAPRRSWTQTRSASRSLRRSFFRTPNPKLQTLAVVMKTYADLLAETKARVKEITVADAMALRHTTGDVQFVDCRDEKEFNLGKIPGAFTVARS